MAQNPPPFDPELEVILNYIPKSEKSGKEWVLESRANTAPLCSPELVLIDPDISHEEVTIPGPGGDIILSVLRSKNAPEGPRPAIYHIHGGGMVIGNRFFLLGTSFPWVKEFNVTLITVEYRLAPEHPDPAPVEDCYAGLKWVSEHASELGINASQIMIAGGSAGGGLAAGVALLARDRKGPAIRAQLLIYPMLDDTCDSVSNLQFPDRGTWTRKNNIWGWDSLLPGTRGTENVSIYAAPSRAKDLSGLPPTFIEVGSNEPFRDEDVAYATKLWESGVETELHVWPGAWHGFNVFAPDAAVSKAASETRMKWMKKKFAEIAATPAV